ncbi:MAG: hypothetical protein OEL84_00615 [Nitrosopumilus sp.]|nr:hypothetical protein [Nitrosopumilus sp.]
MSLFCKQCQSRRLPVILSAGEKTMWLCEKCKNFADIDDFIIREQTEEEIQENIRKIEEFKNVTIAQGEKLVRRKGVN